MKYAFESPFLLYGEMGAFWIFCRNRTKKALSGTMQKKERRRKKNGEIELAYKGNFGKTRSKRLKKNQTKKDLRDASNRPGKEVFEGPRHAARFRHRCFIEIHFPVCARPVVFLPPASPSILK
jgi:hypothetical protein